ncbi:MAG TPA: hypothetical protein VGS21_02810 [Acidimicrobiales bacterium]|nr:hypothetical protein [Acidimicrobiales bacterium]
MRPSVLLVVGLSAVAAVYIGLLTHRYESLSPTATNTCMGWLDSARCFAGFFIGNDRGSIRGTLHTLAIYIFFAAPALIGIHLGVPLLSDDARNGTGRLLWTQSRRRTTIVWVKVALAAVTAAAAFGLLVPVSTWFIHATASEGFVPLSVGFYDNTGLVPFAYAVFAVAVGAAVGALFRSAGFASFMALSVWTGVRAVVGMLRDHLMPAVTVPNSSPAAANSVDSVIVHWANGPKGALLVTFQPGSHYWPMQCIESAIFLVAAAGCIALTAFIVKGKDA